MADNKPTLAYMPRPDENSPAPYIDTNGKEKTVTSATKSTDGQIDFTITTSSKGSNISKCEHVGVTADGHVYVNNEVITQHQDTLIESLERGKRELLHMMTAGNIPRLPEPAALDEGFVGDAPNAHIAHKVREAYKGFQSGKVLDSKEAGKIHDIIEQALQTVPTHRLDTPPQKQ